MWIACGDKPTTIQLDYHEFTEDEPQAVEKPIPRVSRKGHQKVTLLQPAEDGGRFATVIANIEERAQKFRNCDIMKLGRKQRQANSPGPDDSFLDDEDEDGFPQGQVIIPDFEDFFVFQGPIQKFVVSETYNNRINEIKRCISRTGKDAVKRRKKRKDQSVDQETAKKEPTDKQELKQEPPVQSPAKQFKSEKSCEKSSSMLLKSNPRIVRFNRSSSLFLSD